MNKTEKSSKKYALPFREFTGRIHKKAISMAKTAKNTFRGSTLFRTVTAPGFINTSSALIKCAALFAAGFLLGMCETDYMAYPLGIAFLIASGRLSFFVYAGSALAALTYPALGFAFFGVNTLVYIIRKILLSDDFGESARARFILSVLTSFFICGALVLSVSSGKFGSDHDNTELIICCTNYLIGIPICSQIFLPSASNESFDEHKVGFSLCFLCAALTASAGFLPFCGKELSCVFAVICTLLFCVLFGNNSAIACGALFGAATLNHAICAPLCTGAFVFLKLYEKRHIAAYPAFFACSAFISLFTLPQDKLGYTVICTLIATTLFIPAGLVIYANKAASLFEAPLQREAVGEAYTKRMASLSKAFGSVSKLCFGFSGRMRFPDADEARMIVSVCSSRLCNACPESSTCKKKLFWCDPRIADSLLAGKLSVKQLPPRLSESCRNVLAITEDINNEYKRVLCERFGNNKTEILAYEYATVAKILKYTSRMSSEDVYFDGRMTALACTATKKLGLANTGVTVYGSRKKTLDITGVPASCISSPSEKLASFYSTECGELFDSPEYILDEDSTFTVRFVSKETVSAEYVKLSHTKNGETVCGDTISFFRSDDSYFYALIADGMGSGRDAAMTSRLTSVFVEKLLSGGAGKGATMELLNNLLMSKNKECFSSVDLLELDLIRRRISFVKAGAAPAYLLRSAKLFKVSSDTPPCGIIEGFCAENTSFEVFPGDLIIMLSDGITSSIDCGTALCDIMNKSDGKSLETVAGKILDMAVSMAVHEDDMSCVIVRVK